MAPRPADLTETADAGREDDAATPAAETSPLTTSNNGISDSGLPTCITRERVSPGAANTSSGIEDDDTSRDTTWNEISCDLHNTSALLDNKRDDCVKQANKDAKEKHEMSSSGSAAASQPPKLVPGASRVYPLGRPAAAELDSFSINSEDHHHHHHHHHHQQAPPFSVEIVTGILPAAEEVTSNIPDGHQHQEAIRNATHHTSQDPLLIGVTVVVPSGVESTEDIEADVVEADVLPAAVYPFVPVKVKPIQGVVYVHTKCVLLFLFVATVMVSVIAGIVVSRSKHMGSQDTPSSSSPWWTDKASNVEQFAQSLPAYTLETLQNELPEKSRSNWFYNELWGSNNTFEPVSAQGKAWKWLMSDPDLASRLAQDTATRFSLATFYYATDGPNWKNNTNWLSTTEHVCDWATNAAVSPSKYRDYKKRCAERGFSQITLANNGLQGSIPPELALLSLTSFEISENKLHGEIPEVVWNSWQELSSLLLFNNVLNGTLSTTIGLLTDLEDFRGQNNQFSGSIPSELGELQQLLYFAVSDNMLQGSLPSELGNAQQFLSFFVSGNRLTGAIPTQVGLWKGMWYFDLSNNNGITGQLPTELGTMSRLLSVDLSNTSVEGSIPSEMGSIPGLATLDISGTDMTGSVPFSVCSVLSLDVVANCSSIQCDCNCTCASPP
jgi:hypothetical protein